MNDEEIHHLVEISGFLEEYILEFFEKTMDHNNLREHAVSVFGAVLLGLVGRHIQMLKREGGERAARFSSSLEEVKIKALLR